MSEASRITVNPSQCGGAPCIRGMHLRVKDVLDLLADGGSRDEILADYEYLEDADISAALEYAASKMKLLARANSTTTADFLRVSKKLPPIDAKKFFEDVRAAFEPSVSDAIDAAAGQITLAVTLEPDLAVRYPTPESVIAALRATTKMTDAELLEAQVAMIEHLQREHGPICDLAEAEKQWSTEEQPQRHTDDAR